MTYQRRNDIPKNVDSAYYISECWHNSYLQRYFTENKIYKRLGLYSRLRAAIVHDRVLNGTKADGSADLQTSWAREMRND